MAVLAAVSGVTLFEAYQECARVEAKIEASTNAILAATNERMKIGRKIVMILDPVASIEPTFGMQ
jgi:hypothetical protein